MPQHTMPSVDTFFKRLGSQLAEMRHEAGLSQRALALKLGLTQGRLSQIEGGDPRVSTEILGGYLRACDKDMLDLVLACRRAESEEEIAEMALRTYGLGSPAAMTAKVRGVALEGIIQHRRTVQALLEGREEDEDEDEEGEAIAEKGQD